MSKIAYVTVALAAALFPILLTSPARAGKLRFINDGDTVVLHGNTHPLARTGKSAGYADVSLPMEHMILSLRRSADKQAALESFLKDQQDPASADFHRWLMPEEFGSRFGPAAEDVAAVSDWLSAHGFTVEEVAASRISINFSGIVAKVERTFKTRIKDVTIGDRLFHANENDPSIPRGLADLVSGIVTLHNIPRQPANNGGKPFASNDAVPNYTSGSSHFLAPGDFSTIYNVKSVYAAGVDGTGQSIAITGRTHPSASNWSKFRSTMGLAANAPQVILNGTDPGDLGRSEDTEANLDVEWSGAVATGATIKFVVSKSTNTTDGIDLSSQYIVNNDLAPVMSLSFGSCESDMGSAENAFFNSLWAQAAAQGITVMVSTGDSGAAGCSSASLATGSGRAVNGLASTPYNVAVGGSQFSEGTGTYWNSVTGANDTSALGYIPEVAWNESGNASGGNGLWATGGGASQVYAKPAWQAAPGVPQDGVRDLPDVALSAAGHDGYLIISGGSLANVGGTSAAAPAFAGLMALVVQKTGQRQGNANIRMYQLANSQFAAGGASVFHDVVSGNNGVPGVPGYAATPGYDLATGLGSVDANALLGNWNAVAATPTGTSSVAVNTVNTGGTTRVSYQTLQEAYDNATSGAVIQATAGTLAGNLVANRAIDVSIKGGYDPSYSSNTGSTTLLGTVTLQYGSVVFDNFAM